MLIFGNKSDNKNVKRFGEFVTNSMLATSLTFSTTIGCVTSGMKNV